MKHLLVLSNF